MTKQFMGARIKRLRQERGLTQAQLAQSLQLSASYLNQLEHDQRPLTAQVLDRLSEFLGVDAEYFSEENERRLVADLRDALSSLQPEHLVSNRDLHQLATTAPQIAQAVLELHSRYLAALDAAANLASRIGELPRAPTLPMNPMPYEEVRDYFYARSNYIAELDIHAENLAIELRLSPDNYVAKLIERLAERHQIETRLSGSPGSQRIWRRFEPNERLLELPSHLSQRQRAFQLATQLALLETSALLDQLTECSELSSSESKALTRIGLAHYFAGALLMPYERFLDAAKSTGYDIDQLQAQFGVGFESVCHRLSTMQRPGKRGVPFFFIRVDRAGNVSKRQSATAFHFSRVGGTCPLWNVYEAFSQPGRTLTQLAQMPEGRTYLWIARSVASAQQRYAEPTKLFSIGLGCDVAHASQLVYSRGLDLRDPAAPTPIGAGCKVCPRKSCTQRAFPPLGETITVNLNQSDRAPYPFRANSTEN